MASTARATVAPMALSSGADDAEVRGPRSTGLGRTPVATHVEGRLVTEREETLRRLSLHDDRLLDDVLKATEESGTCGGLEPRATALVRLGALVGVGGSSSSFAAAAATGLASGASIDDLVDALVAAAPIVGSARVVDAAPKLALGVGYDVERDFEDPDRT